MKAIFGGFLMAVLAVGGAQAAVRTQSIEYRQGGAVLVGYLAYDDSMTGRRPGVLDDEDVAAADVLVEADRHLTVLEAPHVGVPDRRLELFADRRRQPPAGVAREDPIRIQDQFLPLESMGDRDQRSRSIRALLSIHPCPRGPMGPGAQRRRTARYVEQTAVSPRSRQPTERG